MKVTEFDPIDDAIVLYRGEAHAVHQHLPLRAGWDCLLRGAEPIADQPVGGRISDETVLENCSAA